MSAVSTHVLDTVRGEPASGIVVRLERVGGSELGRATTDADGRISDFGVSSLPAGIYRLIFETAAYLAGKGLVVAEPESTPFFPEIVVTFAADGLRPRYHVPLLLSPYSYATYRGS